MLSFFFQQILFYLALALVLVVPGYALARLFGKKIHNLNVVEFWLFSIGISVAIINFLMLTMGKIGMPITRWSLLGVIALWTLTCTLPLIIKKTKILRVSHQPFPSFSIKQKKILFSLVLVTILIKLFYLSGSIFPTSTDLGHHMYWSNVIVSDGIIPVYEKTEITLDGNLETVPIADFIIGEHLIFAAISMISGISVISAFPVLVLFLLHLLTIAALFILVLRFFQNNESAQTIALFSLLLAGPLFALSSPQMKFITGGVIGNTFGNYFIPLMLLAYYRALKEKDSWILAIGLLLSIALAYTHHLSSFVFIFISLFSVAIYAVLNFKTLHREALKWIRTAFHGAPLITLAVGVLFMFLVYTPTYLNTKAVDTAVGTPSKSTRVGFTLTQLANGTGDARFAFGLLGLGALLLIRKNRDPHAQALLGGWATALLIMSLKPHWLLIDIPSNRIASYINFPIALLAGYFFSLLFQTWRKNNSVRPMFAIVTALLLISFTVQSGTYDNAQSTNNTQKDIAQIVQVHSASQYLAERSNDSDTVVKDHNYLVADSWIKLFFMRGYNYPFSRAYFKRYEDATKPREMCTYYMITTPNTSQASDCFESTNTNYIMVNPAYDGAQFKRSDEFWHVYASDSVSIYHKPQQ